jgi:aminoglycoside phosphotransferase (APT) family kinase protein
VARAAPEREAQLNALLRRVDWRVLLPDPTPQRSVCFDAGPLREAVALVSASVVDPLRATGCDLAVASDPDEATLCAAAAALAPGGACYTEWHRFRVGGVAAVRRRLAAAGFDEVRCYWAWPPPSRSAPSFWLPLEAPGALAYFVASRARAASPLLRLVYLARRTLWRLGRRLGLALPVLAVATKPGGGESRGLVADIPRLVRGVPGDASVSLLLLTGGPRSISKIVALAFSEPDPEPLVAIKLPRTPDAGPLLEREAAVLRALDAKAPNLTGVPRVSFARGEGHALAIGETPILGTPLFAVLRQEQYVSLALRCTDWLVELAGRTSPAPRATWWDELGQPVVDDFRRDFGAVVAPSALEQADALLRRLDRLPIVPEHRDFAPWNIVVTPGGGIGVLDWEGAQLEGLAGVDLIYFLAYLAFFLDGNVESGAYRESYRACFDPSTFTGKASAACLDTYSARVGVPAEAWPALRVFVWMLKARSEHRRFVEDAGGTPAQEVLRGSIFLGLWEEELRRVRGR